VWTEQEIVGMAVMVLGFAMTAGGWKISQERVKSDLEEMERSYSRFRESVLQRLTHLETHLGLISKKSGRPHFMGEEE